LLISLAIEKNVITKEICRVYCLLCSIVRCYFCESESGTHLGKWLYPIIAHAVPWQRTSRDLNSIVSIAQVCVFVSSNTRLTPRVITRSPAHLSGYPRMPPTKVSGVRAIISGRLPRPNPLTVVGYVQLLAGTFRGCQPPKRLVGYPVGQKVLTVQTIARLLNVTRY